MEAEIIIRTKRKIFNKVQGKMEMDNLKKEFLKNLWRQKDTDIEIYLEYYYLIGSDSEKRKFLIQMKKDIKKDIKDRKLHASTLTIPEFMQKQGIDKTLFEDFQTDREIKARICYEWIKKRLKHFQDNISIFNGKTFKLNNYERNRIKNW